jgi:hypothetical protein
MSRFPANPSTPGPNSPPAKSGRRAAWIVVGTFTALGLIFIAVGVGICWRTFQFDGKSIAPGVVAQTIHEGDKVRPVVKYTVDGRDYEIKGAIASNIDPFKMNDRVPVLFRPDNPGDAQIDCFIERWLFLTIFGVIGAVLLSTAFWISVVLLVVGAWRRSQSTNLNDARFTVE